MVSIEARQRSPRLHESTTIRISHWIDPKIIKNITTKMGTSRWRQQGRVRRP
jgi:hypothetical protein